jgi:hypothetical protein
MDPVAILGLSYAGKEAVSVVSEFVKEIFGPSAKALGDGIAAPLKVWAEQRHQRAGRLVIDAAMVLDHVGVKANAVPGEILIPLLQAGSATEQPEVGGHRDRRRCETAKGEELDVARELAAGGIRHRPAIIAAAE